MSDTLRERVAHELHRWLWFTPSHKMRETLVQTSVHECLVEADAILSLVNSDTEVLLREHEDERDEWKAREAKLRDALEYARPFLAHVRCGDPGCHTCEAMIGGIKQIDAALAGGRGEK